MEKACIFSNVNKESKLNSNNANIQKCENLMK